MHGHISEEHATTPQVNQRPWFSYLRCNTQHAGRFAQYRLYAARLFLEEISLSRQQSRTTQTIETLKALSASSLGNSFLSLTHVRDLLEETHSCRKERKTSQ